MLLILNLSGWVLAASKYGIIHINLKLHIVRGYCVHARHFSNITSTRWKSLSNFISDFFFFFQCHMFTYKGSVYIELFKRTEEQEHDFSKCHYPLFRKKEVKIISVSKGFRGQKTEGEQLSHTPF